MANPLYVPLNVDIGDTSGKLTVPWRQFFQALNGTMGPVATAITQLTGDVTAGPGPGSVAATIANDAVTYAKMQNVSAASRLLGRGSAAGAGNVEEISLGTGLTMSATTLNASVGTVTNTGTLTDHAVIVGNGGVDVSALASLGTTTTVLHGNASGDPTFGAVSLTADVSGVLPVANGGTGSSVGASLRRAVQVLTNAQIKTLPTAPIALVGAQGAGTTIVFHSAILMGDFQAGAYSGVNATLSFLTCRMASTDVSSYIANDSGATPAMTYLTDFLTTTGYILGPVLVPQQFTADPTLLWGLLANGPLGVFDNTNLALYVDNGGVDFGSGHADNSLTVVTYYTVETIP